MAFNLSLKRNIFPMTDWNKFLEKGKEEFDYLVNMKSTTSYNRNSFDFISTLGAGAFGRVFLVKMKGTDDFYAIKLLEKSRIIKKKQVNHTINERKVLQAFNHPFMIYSVCSFQDNSFLYIVLPFVEGGEMFTHLRKRRRFTEDQAKFYGSQVILALEYLHYCGMVFRDLKPENILIHRTGYIKLTDFGFCKIINQRTYTLCGTPEYLAPEIILSKGYGMAVDWWSFGVLVFEMCAGSSPFQAPEAMKTYEKIVAGNYSCPKMFTPDLKDLIKNLLQVDLTRRYGNLRNGLNDIKMHMWFEGINWMDVFNMKITPPFLPDVKGPGDASNFEKFQEIELTNRSINLFSNTFADF